jgi:hypothetical protein
LPPLPIDLVDATDEAGVRFVHTHGGTGHMYILESVSAGLATFDYDGDGWTDIYLVNGAPLPGAKPGTAPRDALYRNLGGLRFVDVTDDAGLADDRHGLGVAVGDYNNDGYPDLAVTNFGGDVLYRNNGDGTFESVGKTAGIQDDDDNIGAGACFVDVDNDGNLDLYSANYCKFSTAAHPNRLIGGLLRAPSPLDFAPVPDCLFRNRGDGTFEDVSESSGIRKLAGRGMGVVAGDFDNDGDSDILVANDVMANYLLENDGEGNFRNVAPTSGVAYGAWGKANGNMGVDCADFDNDGWFDLVVTTYQAEMPVLHRNLGNAVFEDVAIRSNFGTETLPHVKWGVGFPDIDNDGDRDIFVANGHLEDKIHLVDVSTAYRVPNALYLNDGAGRFRDVLQEAGSGMAVAASSRGSAFDDLDNDGDLDGVILNAEDKPTLLRNDSTASGNWLQLDLRGTVSNRDGVGARVKVAAGKLVQIDEVRSGRGYQSHYGSRLQFGLGSEERVELLEIRWPSGAVTTRKGVATNQRLIIVEDPSPHFSPAG